MESTNTNTNLIRERNELKERLSKSMFNNTPQIYGQPYNELLSSQQQQQQQQQLPQQQELENINNTDSLIKSLHVLESKPRKSLMEELSDNTQKIYDEKKRLYAAYKVHVLLYLYNILIIIGIR